MLFLTRVGARRQITHLFKTTEFLQYLNMMSNSECETVAHGDTLNYLLRKLDPAWLNGVRRKMVQRLLRMRCLEDFRLMGRLWMVAIDGTGHLTFRERHCPYCLERESFPGHKMYYHQALEAKLVFSNGLAISIDTEFIDNRFGTDKQDCELNAFCRLAARLKETYPQLKLCLLLDGLYANRPVMELCRQNRWEYIITFKEGSMPAVYDWYERLQKLRPDDKAEVRLKDGTVQRYSWVSPFEHYSEGWISHVLQCEEERPGGKRKKFVWLTSIAITRNNFQDIANDGGRDRWKIENQGFNMQKNGGYRLEHPYSTAEWGMKNFYTLLQIAHVICQLMEKGSLFKKRFVHGLGSIRNMALRLLEDLRCRSFDPSCLAVRIQIRIDSS